MHIIAMHENAHACMYVYIFSHNAQGVQEPVNNVYTLNMKIEYCIVLPVNM